MRVFTKLLLFCSVPSILFALLAVPSLNKKDRPAGGSQWPALRAAGVQYLRPPGWRVSDPLTTGTEILDELWSMTWPNRASVHAASFSAPRGQGQLLLFAGPTAELLPIAEQADGYYLDSVMVRREDTEYLTTMDGTELRLEVARYLPGSLNGADSTMWLAWCTQGDLTLLANAAGPTEGFPAEVLRDVLTHLSLGE